MENEKIECKWLNKNFGDGYWICDGFLKATNKEICKDCPEKKKERSKSPYKNVIKHIKSH